MSDWRDKILRINGTVDDSIVDGPGMRYTIFVQGCPHRCPACHNPQTHDFDGGQDVTLGSLMDEVSENPLLSGVTFSGGEPFCQPEILAVLGREIKNRGYDLTAFSGYTYEQLLVKSTQNPAVGELLNQVDLLVDGPFILAQRNLELLYRGSENQRLIDLAAMREAGDLKQIILWEEDY